MAVYYNALSHAYAYEGYIIIWIVNSHLYIKAILSSIVYT